MSQLSFTDAEHQIKKRKTRREVFLERMELLIPWSRLEKRAAKHYPKGTTGRPPYPLATMIRVHCLQLFYNLSDPAMEDALYEIESMRRFAKLTLSEPIPDETTILNFRHFLETHKLGKVFLKEINFHLKNNGLFLREGTIVDATIISAPSSTKNKDNARDPEMDSTQKANQWHFGMKAHIGVDAATGLIHSLETTKASVHDVTQTSKLLHGDETHLFGDSGYIGAQKRPELIHKKELKWNINLRPSQLKKLPAAARKIEHIKSQIRAKVEHPFKYIKQVFGYSKVRYRGLEKNHNRLCFLAGLTNLLLSRKYLLP